MDLPTLGRALQERREAIGLSQGAVARRVGVSDSYISSVERAVPKKHGRPAQPSEGVLERWWQALGWDEANTDDQPYIRQLRMLAGHVPEGDEDDEETPELPFDTPAALHYPQPKTLTRRHERERLHQSLDELLDEIEGDDSSWQVGNALLRSYLSWLVYYLRE